jgi:two-component system, NarL family, invasion response regulator UvrY
MIKILVADDHAVVRAGLKQFVSDTTDIIVSGEASDGKEALKKSLEEDYDIVLLDITMPGMNGLDVLKQLKSQKPGLKVLVLTIHPEEQYAMRVLKAGASGYLTKESAPQELISAIRKVASGGRYISSALAEKLVFELGADLERPLYQTLSDREYQVMFMITTGKRLNDIARELSISVKTVSSHRSRILQKLHLNSNAELALYAVNNKLVH